MRYFSTLSRLLALAILASLPAPVALAQRALGLDISAWQGSISQATWNNIRNVENRQFVFIRSSRGGTTGYYNQSDADNSDGLNTLSQRYDDPYFIQNITRATKAGMFAGPYHFGRMDIIASTLNSGGIPNNGTDEANHFLQMAGAWMRPGYLLPVFDFEAGSGIRTPEELAQFAIDFSNRIYADKGIRPAVYIGGNYASPMNSIPSAAALVAAYPTLWTARWPNQADPNSIPVQTADPGDYTPTVYGPWDNPPNPADPWDFWQYASTGRLQSFNNGGSNLDFDVARGGAEFLKDHLVPALWTNDNSGEWTTLTNWNSGATPVEPVQGPGQVARVGGTWTTGTVPARPLPRLPGVDDTVRGVDGQNDTVVLDRPNANITVTLSSGTHNIRKLYAREALNITGGSLTINYVPTADSTPIAAQFSAPVSLGGNATLSVNTLQVDSSQTFTLGGGTLEFNKINLMPHASTPAKIAVTGNVNIQPLGFAAPIIAKGAGSGNSGLIDLGGGNRTLNISQGFGDFDLSIDVPITNGGLTLNGPGRTWFTSANTYGGGTTVSAGRLIVNNTTGSGTGSGGVTVGGTGTLTGKGLISGAVTVGVGGHLAPGLGRGVLTVGGVTLGSGSFLDIEIGGLTAGTQYDKLAVNGDANLGGELKVSLIGFTPSIGHSFTILTAGTVSGAFDALVAPALPNAEWQLTYNPTSVALAVVAPAPIAGDFNGDGMVDGLDLAAWQTHAGMAAGAETSHGDSDSDGDVDGADFLTWQQNLGAGQAAAAAAAVPEPAGAVLLVLGALGVVRHRRSR